MNVREIVYDNTLNQCIEAYNTLNEEFNCYDDKVYHYDDILEELQYRIEAEPSALESILLDFAHIGSEYSSYRIQESYFTYDGYANLVIIEDDTIRDYLIDLIVDNFNEDELEDKLEELFLI